MKITKQSKRSRSIRQKREDVNKEPISKLVDFDANIFTYMDYARNEQSIKYLQKHFDDLIRVYGVPLLYYRKKNTFFEQNDTQKTANPIYGEDTCADYYIEHEVRAFLNISEYQWLYNAMGFEAQEQVTIYLSIQDFRDKFIDQVGKLHSEEFSIEVSGSLNYMEVSGVIDRPEFYSKIYGEVDDKGKVVITPKACQRPLTSQFYKSINSDTDRIPTIYGTLSGKMKDDPDHFGQIKGVVKGTLQFPSLENKDSGPTWEIAPQVGDFFKLSFPGIVSEYVITEIFDSILNNNGGINPLLGKYVFQCTATRRNPSHEQLKTDEMDESISLDNNAPGPSIEQNNNDIDRIANQIYNYSDTNQEDEKFGGY